MHFKPFDSEHLPMGIISIEYGGDNIKFFDRGTLNILRFM